jgi:3-hydroxyisobutyrate dehydrogenase-like beta-hydroxyacid dehydrogenase
MISATAGPSLQLRVADHTNGPQIRPFVLEQRPIVCANRRARTQIERMSEVSVLGLGVMGTALARALLERGDRVTVWNRTTAKAKALESAGVRAATTPAEAARESPVLIVCVTDYAATYAALEGVDLRNKTVVQLSTGSPADARAGEAWAKERGAAYLDGAILATPRQIGTPASSILVSGSASAFASSRELVAHMAGTLTYLGERVAAAAAFDLAFLSWLFPALLGYYDSLRLIESEGLDLAGYAAMTEASGPAAIQILVQEAQTVISGQYGEPEATLATCHAALQLMQRHAREAGLDGTLAAFVTERFQAGLSAGFGNESPAALVKLLRARNSRPSAGAHSPRGVE